MDVPGDFETTLSLRRPGREPPTVPVLADFEVGRFLGGGGMGVVFEGRDRLGRRVALKFRRRGVLGRDEARARLLREAQAMAHIRHRNVVALVEVGLAGDEVFIAMELVEGGTLRDWMHEPREWREVVDLFIGFGRGLARVHARGIVHRDVNPSNLFLASDGTPKLGDFGLAITADDAADDTGLVVGTPGYLAPEQIGGGRADMRSDQYAFCVSLYEALGGRRPVDSNAELAAPRALREILARGLSPQPSARFPAFTALLSALSRARR
jgi:serine/threonine protein kinase